MSIKLIVTDDAPQPGGHYSHAASVGGLIAVSGQVGKDPSTGEMPADIGSQTTLALENIERILVAAGGRLSDVVKASCYLRDISTFAEFNAAYAAAFGDHRPARCTVAADLAADFGVEIEVLAFVSP